MMAHLHAVTDNRGALRYNEFHLSAVLASPGASSMSPDRPTDVQFVALQEFVSA